MYKYVYNVIRDELYNREQKNADKGRWGRKYFRFSFKNTEHENQVFSDGKCESNLRGNKGKKEPQQKNNSDI